MTCGVALLNKLGAALAIDSAVTVGDNKVYNNAEKLFRLSDVAPVAIMHSGNTEMTGVPWEIIIKMYRSRLGERKLERLADYRNDFIQFLKSSLEYFPEEQQRHCYDRTVYGYWRNNILVSVWEEHGAEVAKWGPEAWQAVEASIERDLAYWKYDPLESVEPQFGKKLLKVYADVLKSHEERLFDGVAVPENIRAGLHRLADNMYSQRWVSSAVSSHLMIIGYGEREVFPQMLGLCMDGFVGGSLRWYTYDEVSIGRDTNSVTLPFGQGDMINMFYNGFQSGVQDAFVAAFRGAIGSIIHKEGESPEEATAAEQACETVMNQALEKAWKYVQEEYKPPITAAVSAMPLRDLAQAAKSLVSVAALRAKLNTEEMGSVGGEVNVAIISKGDGFHWVDRRNLNVPLRG